MGKSPLRVALEQGSQIDALLKSRHLPGFADGIAAAVAMCEFAERAYSRGAGSAHSDEARKVGISQCQWLAREIANLKPNE